VISVLSGSWGCNSTGLPWAWAACLYKWASLILDCSLKPAINTATTLENNICSTLTWTLYAEHCCQIPSGLLGQSSRKNLAAGEN
jgi:hypothetical protein